jgi:hypothetical protein
LPAGGTPPWDTATNLVSDAAIELGLVSAPVSDVFGSTDQNIVQLRTYLKSGCRELGRLRDWTHTVKQYVFTTSTGVPTYPLPADFRQMIDQSGWNRTNRLPLGGPLSAQEWEYLKARLVGVVFTVLFRPWQGTLYLYPDTNTPGGYSIAYEYISRYFVQPSGVGSPTSETPSANSDTICFEPQLVVKKLKLDFKRGKGFDYSMEQEDFDKALEMIKGDDSAMPMLRLNRQNMVDPLLGQQNVPLTGYG